MSNRIYVAAATAVLLVQATMAMAGPTESEKCEADKLKRTGGYSSCRMKADSKAVKKATVADYEKCDLKLADSFAKADDKYGLECPTSDDVDDIQTQVTGDTDDLSVLLSGGALPPVGCGDGVADLGESCDGLDLNGESCETLGYAATPDLACTAACRLDSSACSAIGGGIGYPSRFRDNGDGTATDLVSGLIWEIKDDLAGIHDKDNRYTWCIPAGQFNCVDNIGFTFAGTAKTVFIDGLNDVVGGGASCFAGSCDWRLPTTLELQGLIRTAADCSAVPCVDQDLPGETITTNPPVIDSYYWTSTVDPQPSAVWSISFGNGAHPINAASLPLAVRAVRGGL